MDVTILYDRVLIEKIEHESKTASGLVLAGGPTDAVFEATVIKVGEGTRSKDGTLIPLAVNVGDKVVYDPTKIIPVTLDGKTYFVIREENIFGVLN